MNKNTFSGDPSSTADASLREELDRPTASRGVPREERSKVCNAFTQQLSR